MHGPVRAKAKRQRTAVRPRVVPGVDAHLAGPPRAVDDARKALVPLLVPNAPPTEQRDAMHPRRRGPRRDPCRRLRSPGCAAHARSRGKGVRRRRGVRRRGIHRARHPRVRRRLLHAKTLEPAVLPGAPHLRRRHGLGRTLQEARRRSAVRTCPSTGHVSRHNQDHRGQQRARHKPAGAVLRQGHVFTLPVDSRRAADQDPSAAASLPPPPTELQTLRGAVIFTSGAFHACHPPADRRRPAMIVSFASHVASSRRCEDGEERAGLFKSRHWRGVAGGECRDRGHLALVRGRDALDPGVLAPRHGPTWRDTNVEWRLLNRPGGTGRRTYMRSPGVISVPNPSAAPQIHLLDRLGGIAAERVWSSPAPGTATEDDLLHAHDHEGRLCELVDGVLVEKAMGFRESLLAGALIEVLRGFVMIDGTSSVSRCEAPPGVIGGPRPMSPHIAGTSRSEDRRTRCEGAAAGSVAPAFARNPFS